MNYLTPGVSPGATLTFDFYGNMNYGFSANSLIQSLETMDGFVSLSDCSIAYAANVPCDQALTVNVLPAPNGVSMNPGFSAQSPTLSGSGVANVSRSFQIPPYPSIPVTPRPIPVRPSTLRPPTNTGQPSFASNGSQNYYNGLALSGVNLYQAWALLMENLLGGNLSY